MKGPTEKPTVRLTEVDGNSFAILGAVKRALTRAGADKEYISKYLKEAMAADYDNLLVVSMKYVDVE